MNDTLIKSQTDLVKKAEEEITQSNQLLESFVNEWNKTSEHPLEDLANIRTLQLVLQYRLDTQNSLNQLSKLQNYLLQLLGIEAMHSQEVNMERLAFALGNDDLQHVLTMLNHLVDSLLRVLAHNLQHQSLDRKKALERTKTTKLIDIMAKVIEKQKNFSSHINELKLSLESVEGAPHPGIILDHIAALEGPISRFHQALQHGLILSSGLYQQMHLQNNLKFQLADTLQTPEQAFEHVNYHPEHQRLFNPTYKNTDADRLEERALAKRLGNFFNR